MLKSMASNKDISKCRKPKRFRSAFTTDQINYLEKQFRTFPYISGEHRKVVAAHLKMDERPVKIWFQNRRMKEKRDCMECGSSGETGNNNQQEFEDQLFVVPTANDLRSLPTTSSAVDATDKLNTDWNVSKANNIEQLKVPRKTDFTMNPNISLTKVNHYREALRHDFRIHQGFPTLEAKKKIASQNKLKQTSVEYSKKGKESTSLKGLHNKRENGTRGSLENTVNKKSKTSQRAPMPATVPMESCVLPTLIKHPVHYPYVPTIYSPHFVSPDVIWRPVDVMPVTATSTGISQRLNEDKVCCNCKCHENISQMPTTFSQNVHRPYAQYVISVPLPNPVHKM